MYPLEVCPLSASLPTDPTFTVENMMEMTKEVECELLTLNILQVPTSVSMELDDQYQSEEQRREAAISHFLLTHPCPSWRWLSRRLQQSYDPAAVAAAVEVTRKYVRGEYSGVNNICTGEMVFSSKQ